MMLDDHECLAKRFSGKETLTLLLGGGNLMKIRKEKYSMLNVNPVYTLLPSSVYLYGN